MKHVYQGGASVPKGSPLSVMERARRYLAEVPPAISGQGGHAQTFRAACALVHGFALDPDQALALLREYNERCVPRWPESSLIHKVQDAARVAHEKPRGYLLGADRPALPSARPLVRKPQYADPATEAEKYLAGFRCSAGELSSASPVPLPSLEEWQQGGALLLRSLYGPEERLNIVTKAAFSPDGKWNPAGIGDIMPRDAWLARWENAGMPQGEGGAWLRMNPLSGGGVADKDVASWRFGLLEFDALPLDLQSSLFARLKLPISAVISSAGRSLHAWVRISAESEAAYREAVARVFSLLERFGIDTRNRNPSRLSRLPGALRTAASGGGRQTLVYLNPEVNPSYPICSI